MTVTGRGDNPSYDTWFKCHLPPGFLFGNLEKNSHPGPQFFATPKNLPPPNDSEDLEVNAVGKRTEHHDNPQPSPTDDPREIGFVSSVVCVEVEETALHIVPWRLFFLSGDLWILFERLSEVVALGRGLKLISIMNTTTQGCTS